MKENNCSIIFSVWHSKKTFQYWRWVDVFSDKEKAEKYYKDISTSTDIEKVFFITSSDDLAAVPYWERFRLVDYIKNMIDTRQYKNELVKEFLINISGYKPIKDIPERLPELRNYLLGITKKQTIAEIKNTAVSWFSDNNYSDQSIILDIHVSDDNGAAFPVNYDYSEKGIVDSVYWERGKLIIGIDIF